MTEPDGLYLIKEINTVCKWSNMKKISLILCLLLLVSFPTCAQVGIDTTNPQETLHVNGKIRVTDTDFDVERTMVSVIGVETEGNLNKIPLGPGIVMVKNNYLIGAGSGYYSMKDHTLVTSQNIHFDDLGVGLAGDYALKTVIRFIGQTNSFDITGIEGGFAGKHVILLNPSSHRMRLLDDSIDSSFENRILTYGNGPAETLQGQGAIELVYDGYQWIVLNVRE